MSSKRVLVVGSGFSSPPLIKYLAGSCNYQVTLASRNKISAQLLAEGLTERVRVVQLDVETTEGKELLDELAPSHDALVSMLPYLLHPVVASIAVAHKKHFFTTSYTTDYMRELGEQAEKAGVIIVNECGVDPGTDHMSAMKVIHQVQKKGGKIVSFTSFCGGLPAPSSNTNPLGYKLSWAPRGVLLASRNDAQFLRDGKNILIPGKDLFDNFEVVELPEIGKLERYPNRNSTQYIELYGITETQTMIRGTYRYPGFCQTIKKLADLGFLGMEELSFEGKTFADITRQALSTDCEDIKAKVAEFLKIQKDSVVINNMEYLGLFSDKKVPQHVHTYLDALCELCKEKLQYAPGERDMIAMRHEFIAEYPDRKEWISSTLVDYGIPNGDTSMSRTVSFPVGIAVRLVLEGKVKLSGLQRPLIPELYEPILQELEKEGIKFIETVEKVEKK